jgi:hypothetical protein
MPWGKTNIRLKSAPRFALPAYHAGVQIRFFAHNSSSSTFIFDLSKLSVYAFIGINKVKALPELKVLETR